VRGGREALGKAQNIQRVRLWLVVGSMDPPSDQEMEDEPCIRIELVLPFYEIMQGT
jgi:hypothetical protein